MEGGGGGGEVGFMSVDELADLAQVLHRSG